jgi:hypothetical protein
MDSPRSGMRRARAVSWALAGLGIAGVAGTSTLAYADTFRPPATEVPTVAVDPAPPEFDPAPALEMPPALSPVATTTEPALPVTTEPPPPGTPGTGVIQSPETHRAQEPDYTSRRTYEPAPPLVAHESQPPTLPTTKRHILTPTTVMSPNFSPRISTSRGS